MTQSQVVRITLTVVTCGDCGIVFGLEKGHERRAAETGELFYCPNGHHVHYTSDKNTELRKKLERAQQSVAFWEGCTREERQAKEAVARSRAAVKGQLTRTRRRVARGVCPCCNRTFKDLAQHMAGQHPEYDA